MQNNVLHRALVAMMLTVLMLAALPSGRAQAATQTIYADALAASWSNYSWATVNLAATAPAHAGSKSIAVAYAGWDGLYLAHPGVSTAGFTKLSFFIHGGSAGGQKLMVYATRAGDGASQHGPEVAVPAPAANAWTQVQIPLSSLQATNTTITGLTWQASIGTVQSALYIDDIALANDASPDGPVLTAGDLLPRAAPADGSTAVIVRVHVSDPQGAGDIASVTLDAAALGRGSVALRDDGRSNDGAAGDGVYGAAFTVAPGTPAGEQMLLVAAQDQAGHSANLALGAFDMLARAGGTIPASLPQRLGWGTNDWSETAGQDWQANSGVPWDYVYQYITYEWYSDPGHWGGNFVGRFAQQAWAKNYIPVISAYLMLGLPPANGEGASQYAAKLQNASAVQNYLAALQLAATEVKGAKPVIFQIDPDFYGFMQQNKYSTGQANPDDPSSYPVALNVAGYSNNLAGFGRRIVDLIHATAPNALVGPHASMWATNSDPNNVTAAQAQSMAQHTAAFINAMGGAQADVLFVEWSDRDAGSGLRPFWDDTNHDLPRPSRAVLWENALSAATGRRLILWQVPVGNMALNNTCDHYQDNKAAYLFNHPRDVVDAGVIAVLFGGGAACMTSPATDGGFLAAQGAIAYAAPAAPAGLGVSSVAGPTVGLFWQENSEPDLAGYRLRYQPQGGGASATLDVSRANVTHIVLPYAGSWNISIAAIDAMGKVGAFSAAVPAATTADAQRVFLPLLRQ